MSPGAVGVMMAVVMGVAPDDEDTLDRACDLGLAFQLANIARPGRGRRGALLPARRMAGGSRPSAGRQLKPPYRATWRGWPRGCANGRRRTAVRRGSARRLAPRQRWAILAAAGIYGDRRARSPGAARRRGTAARWFRVARSRIGKRVRALLPVPAPCHAGAETRRFTRRDLIAMTRPR
jgi:phytoene synthase